MGTDRLPLTGYEILQAIKKSMVELEMESRTPVRVRIHPLDAETIIAMRKPQLANRRLTKVLGLEVVYDSSSRRLGEPIAEFEED